MKVSMLPFFRASLLLPIVTPIALSPLSWLFPDRPIGGIAEYFASTLILGGIPYLFLAVYGFLWLRGKSERQIVRRALLTPLLFIPVETVALAVWIFVFELSDKRQITGASLIDLWWTLVMAGGFVLVFGYFYVGVVLGLYDLAKKNGIVRPSSTA